MAAVMMSERSMPDSLFERFGTIAFEHEHMCNWIQYGRPRLSPDGQFTGWVGPFNEISLDVWIMTVPGVYRDVVMEIALSVFKDFVFQQATDAIRIGFVTELHNRIASIKDPKYLTGEQA
jgi:hypothetical protein